MLLLTIACTAAPDDTGAPDYRLYVAVEADGAVAVVDPATASVSATADLTDGSTMYMPHNVQAAPDGGSAWVTAMYMPMGDDPAPDQLVRLSADGAVEARIDVGLDQHPAHVVLSATTAWLSATDVDRIYTVDLATDALTPFYDLDPGAQPHGIRLTPDGGTLVVATLGSQSLVTLDTTTAQATSYDVGGRAVQAGVLRDGSAAFVSVYDTLQVARLDLATRQLDFWDLPEGSAGPVQIYPDADNGLWVADQGLVDEGDPAGHQLVHFDATGAVDLVAELGTAPHGVVVCPDGTVWATLVEDSAVAEVDPTTGEVLATIPVGGEPNGISCAWEGGAMP